MSIKNKEQIKVKDVMLPLANVPIVESDAILKEALEKMTAYKLGITCVVNKNNHFLGLITDGDMRRILLSVQRPLSALFVEDVLDHVSKSPTYVSPELSINEATKLIGEKSVWDLPVVSQDMSLLGLFHLHKALEYYLKFETK
jgi:CBS domain-containing protein